MGNIINIGGGAGGSGSNVVPNPQGTATDTLTKIGIDGTIYGFAGNGGHNYSTTEQVVGTWIDGSTLYEKTCNFTGTFYGNTTVGNISVSAFDEIVDITGISKANDGIYKELVFAHPTASNNFGVFIKLNGDVELRSGGALTSTTYLSKIIITIRYTKSST